MLAAQSYHIGFASSLQYTMPMPQRCSTAFYGSQSLMTPAAPACVLLAVPPLVAVPVQPVHVAQDCFGWLPQSLAQADPAPSVPPTADNNTQQRVSNAPRKAKKHPEGWQQAMINKLRGDKEAQDEVFGKLKGRIWSEAQDVDGCWVVQEAIKVATPDLQKELVKELHSHVLEGMESPHANHVLQKVIQCMPIDLASFIVDELTDVVSACQHVFGCRVVRELIKKHSKETTHSCGLMQKFFWEIMHGFDELVTHVYGKYPLKMLLEHGDCSHQHIIVSQLMEKAQSIAEDEHGSSVMKSALEHCDEDDRAKLVNSLDLEKLRVMEFGIHVARAVANMESKAQGLVLQQPKQHIEQALEDVWCS